MSGCTIPFVVLAVCLQTLLPVGLRFSDTHTSVITVADETYVHNAVMSVLAGTDSGSPKQLGLRTPMEANGLPARQHIVALTETIDPRLAGTAAEAQAARYIQLTFENLGYDTRVQPFSFTVEDDDEEIALSSANVIAVKTGRSDREIIVGAHYDSGDEGQGADDNASGVAAMLEVAGKIRDVETPYTVRFLAFGAEEEDLNGSRYYVEEMSESDMGKTVGMINLDSLIAGDIAYVYGDAETPVSLRNWILETASADSLDLETRAVDELDSPDGTPCECADYGPFQAAGIPFAYFEATNWGLGDADGMTQVDPVFGEQGVIRHTSYDNLGYIDAAFPGRVDQRLDLFVTLLYDLLTRFE